jgi:beta-galactosidase
LANGTYTVTLKFAELYLSQPGGRIFNVAINGQTVLSNFDVVAAAGGGLTAVDRSFTVDVSNGQIVIEFISGVADATINAIEITP